MKIFQEHQSSLRQTRQTESCYATLPRSSSSELKKSQPGTPRRNSGPNSVVDMMSMSMSSVPVSSSGNLSTPSSHHTTPVNTPGMARLQFSVAIVYLHNPSRVIISHQKSSCQSTINFFHQLSFESHQELLSQFLL